MSIGQQEALDILHRSEGHERHTIDPAGYGVEERHALCERTDVVQLDVALHEVLRIGLAGHQLGMVVQPAALEGLAVEIIAPDVRLDQDDRVVTNRVRHDDELAGEYWPEIPEDGLILGKDLATNTLGTENRAEIVEPREVEIRDPVPLRTSVGLDVTDDGLEQGIALLSTWLIADDLRDRRLAQVLPKITTRGFPIHALWPQARQTSPKVRVVVDELVNRFLPKPPWDS